MEELNANPSSNRIEIKESRSGLPVPVNGGIYLHSIYNPEKEAEAFAREYDQSLKQKSRALILGLGFGYHAIEIHRLGRSYHREFKTLVFEPNKDLIEAFEANGGFKEEGIELVHAANPTEVFDSEDFVMFLSGKPAIIRHEASYNLNKKFFQAFLTFKAPQEMSAYESLLSTEASELFKVSETSIEAALEAKEKTGKLRDRSDYALFLMQAVVKSGRRAHQTKS